jgi:4-aminobutyrate aminotransferase/(S)-3-amino-2-methylpropionate transaminase
VGSTWPVYAQAADRGVIVDVDGNSLIDMGAGIAVTNVGNANPAVVTAIQDQAANFTHTCFMVTPYEGYVAVCEKLNELTPGQHAKKSALFNSGAEAVENAIKVSRHFTKRQAIVVVEHAYHGRTNLTMAMTAKSMPYKLGFGPFAPEVYRVPTSYPFHDGLTGLKAAAGAISRIEKEIGANQVAALVIEPIQGEGGFIVPAEGFFKAMADFANANGIVFIADEIQTGFGRTGKWFGSEHEGVVPDVITTAKGIGGGMPLAGVTGRVEIMDSVHTGGMGGTYGGNPVSCAAALAAIDFMQKNDLPKRAEKIGEIMRTRLDEIASKYPLVGDVRGRGAMMAIEIVRPGTTEADIDATQAIIKSCHAEGVLVLTAGTYGNVVRFLPPLVMPEDLLDEALNVIEKAVAQAA